MAKIAIIDDDMAMDILVDAFDTGVTMRCDSSQPRRLSTGQISWQPVI